MKEKHQMIQPVLSSVLYLTGDCTTERLGPTAVIDQQFDAEQGKAVPDSPGRTALIFPCRNNYVLFDGRLGHGVLGSSSKKPRMTMLINWWAEKPQDVNAIPAEVIKQHSLSSCATASHSHKPISNGGPASSGTGLSSDLTQLNLAPPSGIDSKSVSPHTSEPVEAGRTATAEMPNRPDECQKRHQEKPEAEGAVLQSDDAVKTGQDDQGEANQQLSCDQMCHVTQLPRSYAKAEQIEVPAIGIAGWDESPVSVDDVLEIYGLQLTGPSAMHAVAIDHNGFDLFPLDEENLEANAGSIVTAAAFVPVGLVSDQSDSESHDSTCDEVGQ
ncbi:TPA: hypothetical protein ACH3X1_001397 [Trebouxia sp. C0004]